MAIPRWTGRESMRAARRQGGWLYLVELLVVIACVLASLPALHGALGVVVADALDEGVVLRATAFDVMRVLLAALLVAVFLSLVRAREHVPDPVFALSTAPRVLDGDRRDGSPVRHAHRASRGEAASDGADHPSAHIEVLPTPRTRRPAGASGGSFVMWNDSPPFARGGP